MTYCIFIVMMLLLWLALVLYGYSYLTSFSINGPIYFFSFTTLFIPFFIISNVYVKKIIEFKMMLSGISLVALVMTFVVSIIIFLYVVVPLSHIDID
jgi:hypothetical protein